MIRLARLFLIVPLIIAPWSVAYAQNINPCGNVAPVPFAHESVTVSTTAIGLTLATYAPPNDPPRATCALISVDSGGGNIRVWFDGTAPTTSAGIVIVAGSTVAVGALTLDRLLMIRDDSTDGAISAQYSRPPQ